MQRRGPNRIDRQAKPLRIIIFRFDNFFSSKVKVFIIQIVRIVLDRIIKPSTLIVYFKNKLYRNILI